MWFLQSSLQIGLSNGDTLFQRMINPPSEPHASYYLPCKSFSCPGLLIWTFALIGDEMELKMTRPVTSILAPLKGNMLAESVHQPPEMGRDKRLSKGGSMGSLLYGWRVKVVAQKRDEVRNVLENINMHLKSIPLNNSCRGSK
ncbi:hypothetical protein CDAR_382371 [Caerostris darwini]|uniref:Uncharacterized protein n=1 Tax=Caerostris darwini TaxID=1538125 RepID=A0AAV4VXJ5_9ARAC|nr:hypothetical protein CDAR_382371 [Caerostris darwini]